MSLVNRSNITTDNIGDLDTSSNSTFVFTVFHVCLIFIKEVQIQHWYRVRILSSRIRQETRVFCHRYHRCRILRDHLLFVYAVVRFALVIGAIIGTFVIAATVTVLFVVNAIAVALSSIVVAAVIAVAVAVL